MHLKRSNIIAVLAALAVIETQYIISGWVTNYGGNKQIVDYVSFAGTIVSIILAVLAIVYSYYQNFSQQRDSHNLSMQLESLKMTVSRADSSEKVFSDAIERLQDLSLKLDKNISLGEMSREDIGAMRRELRDKVVEGTNIVGGSPFSDGKDDSALIDRIVTRASMPQLAMYYVVVKAAKAGLSLGDAAQEAGACFLDKEAMYNKTFFFGASFTLMDIGVLGVESRDAGKYAVVVRSEEFSEKVVRRLEESKPEDYEDLDVQGIIELTKSFSRAT